MRGSENEEGCLANILALSPELQHLKLTGIPPAEDLLRMQFDPMLPSAVLVPKLETLEIEVAPGWRDFEEIIIAKGQALTDMLRSRVNIADAAHRTYVARPFATVKTWDLNIARGVYDLLERSVVSPKRKLSTEERILFELRTLGKWEGILRRNMKREVPGMSAFLKRDYHVAGKEVSDVVKEMEEYQIQGSDIRLLLVRLAGSEHLHVILTSTSRNGIFRPSWTEV